MKIREIILEAPQQMPNFGTAGQQYNVNYTTAATPPAKKSSKGTNKSTKLKAGPKGLSININGNYTATSPTAALQQVAPNRVAAASQSKESKWKKFQQSRPFKIFGLKTLGPFLIWLEDMSSINELWEAGAFNDHGNKAGEVAQQVRTYYTQLLITRGATMWVAWGTASFATGMAVRGLMALIPGLGWLAGLASFVAQAAVYFILNMEVVQKYLTFTILENLVPEWINDPVYGIAKTLGGFGALVDGALSRAYRKFVSQATDTAKDVADKAVKAGPGVAKDAGAAIKNTASTVAKDAKSVVSPSSQPAQPLGSMSDLAKDL
jgi:hypothetical protein